MTPSLKSAQATLRTALEASDDEYARAVVNLPGGHTWRDINELEIKRCEAAIRAHVDFKAAKAAWEAYVEDGERDEKADRGDWEAHQQRDA